MNRIAPQGPSHPHAGGEVPKEGLEKTLAFVPEQKTHKAEHHSEREALFVGMIPPPTPPLTRCRHIIALLQ